MEKEVSSSPALAFPLQVPSERIENSILREVPAGPYTLLELIEQGLQKNPKARHAWWLAKSAAAKKGRSASSLYPKITLDTKVQKLQLGATATSPLSTTESFGPSIELTYKIFQFGSDLATARNAKALLREANFQFNRELQSIVFNVQAAYYQFCTARALITARESNLKDAENSFEAVSKKKEHGLARIQDWLRAQADKLQAEYELSAANAELERCRAALATFIGNPVSKQFEVREALNVPCTEDLALEVEHLLKTSLDQRADLLAVTEAVSAKKFANEAAEKSAWPKIIGGMSGSSLKHKHQGSWQRNYSAYLGVEWVLFDGFDREYRTIESISQLKAQEALAEAKVLEVLQQTWTAFHAFKSSIGRLASAKALENACTEALSAIRIGYDAGVNSLLDLISSQKTLAGARLSHIQAKADVALHLIELAYASGQLSIKEPTQSL